MQQDPKDYSPIILIRKRNRNVMTSVYPSASSNNRAGEYPSRSFVQNSSFDRKQQFQQQGTAPKENKYTTIMDSFTTNRRRFGAWHLVGAIIAAILSQTIQTITAASQHEGKVFTPTVNNISQSELFSLVPEIRVLAPNRFPKPTQLFNDNTVVPVVQPTIGYHRPTSDAVLAYAEGYSLSYYMMFLETLSATGYVGDVVLAIAEQRIIQPDVVDYLTTFAIVDETDIDKPRSKPNVIVYQTPLQCDTRGSVDYGLRQLTKSGDTDIFQMCRLSNVYGYKDTLTGKVIQTVPDPREGRVVATIRYEWYWIWSLQYSKYSWLMLIDARDTFFQLNPFADLPRTQPSASRRTSNTGGILYMFGENANATRLGISTKNSKWIGNGYGDRTLQYVKDKPTICSGSTMGEQIAIETYLRAMVNEHDECDVHMTGSDQGFHNYLYYSGKLLGAVDTIRTIIVWEQGRGIINNLGALRTQTLQEWGIYNPVNDTVYQWDGITPSPVCHQFDRDNTLHKHLMRKHKEWENQWQLHKLKQPKEKQ